MTCIIGLQHEGKVYIGADGLTCFGSTRAFDTRHKVYKSGSFLIGNSGDVRFNDLVRYAFEIPTDESGAYDMRYMVRSFVPALRTALRDAGAMGKDDDKDTAGGWLLVGVNGQLYEISANFSIYTPRDGYAAIGSGYTYGLSAMMALSDKPPKERIERSLEITAYFESTVAPPFTVLDV
jgi:ATP-dependent protease HslVU (ClpYQ) peptidase subunit